jgi:hypothetical protein
MRRRRARDVRVRYSVDGPMLPAPAARCGRRCRSSARRFRDIGDSYLPCDFLAVAGTFAASGQRADDGVPQRQPPRRGNVLFEHGRIVG